MADGGRVSDETPDGPPRTAPRSVREGLAPATSKAPEIEMPERTVEVEGVEWRVTEAGRAGAGTGGRSSVPLLLLVFRTDRADDVRESMVVGSSLSDLSEEALRTGLNRSRPHRKPDETRPFFEDTHQRNEP